MNFKVVCLNFIYITTIFDLKLLVDLDVDAEGVMDVRENRRIHRAVPCPSATTIVKIYSVDCQVGALLH